MRSEQRMGYNYPPKCRPVCKHINIVRNAFLMKHHVCRKRAQTGASVCPCISEVELAPRKQVRGSCTAWNLHRVGRAHRVDGSCTEWIVLVLVPED